MAGASPPPAGDPSDALRALGHWARALRVADVPPDVLTAARHLLAHIDARIAATPDLGLPASNTLPSATYAAFDGDAHVLGARVGVGIAALRSLDAASLRVEQVLLATVIGVEIGGRIGLATLLSDRATQSSALPGAAAGAAAMAWLGGSDGDAIGHAVGNAIALGSSGAATAPRASGGAAAGLRASSGAAFGSAVAEAAIGGIGGSYDLAEALWRGVAVPLPEALVPGGRWLSRAMVLPELCVPAPLATAVEGLNEILKRHLKAAEKRLRPEQVERIEIRVPFVTWAAEHHEARIPELVGRLVAFHALGPAECAGTTMATEGAGADRAAEIAAVAQRVDVVHDWALSVGLVRSALPHTGPLTWSRYRSLRATLKPHGAWPGWKLPELWPLVLSRPDHLLRASDESREAPLEWPVLVKLYTTRGGWWPERRSLADGAVSSEMPAGTFGADLTGPAGPLLGHR